MERLNKITSWSDSAFIAAKERWDSIAKPLGSFGVLEDMIMKIAAIQGTADVDISKRTAVVFCADHGVVAEGVTQCGSEVTAVCAKAIAEGKSNVNAVAAAFGTDVKAVDVGMISDVDSASLIKRKTSYGTRNFTKEPAMTKDEVTEAIVTGMDIVRDLKESGTKIIVSGEMGIGNTTSASAIASVLLGLPPEKVTGRGAGLSDDGLKRKIDAIKRGTELHKPSADDPVYLLQTLGGFEIAAMTGLFLGGAVYKIPVVIDGVISAVAAAIAFKMKPDCAEYMLPSHCSGEPAAKGLLDMLGLHPAIDAGLRLGEGTGGLLLLPLLDGALALYRNSHTFDEENIAKYENLS